MAAVCMTLVSWAVLSGCQGDKFYLGADARVAFSQDTVLFDTVFTTIGSASQAFRIVNDSPGRILLEDISLEDGEGSLFRINVDGIPGPSVGNLALEEGDSLYVFVEVTIDPGSANLPFIVQDRIRVIINGFSQFVTLNAYGQNAFFHGAPGSLTTLPCDEVWVAQRPHVIYGVVGVAEGCNLTIEAGSAIHVHAGGGIYVDRGTLEANGELGQEVVFEGDRLEPSYADIPGQWGIQSGHAGPDRFGRGFTGEHRRRGHLAVRLYARQRHAPRHRAQRDHRLYRWTRQGQPGAAALTMENCVTVHNMSGIGLLAQGSPNVDGTNNC